MAGTAVFRTLRLPRRWQKPREPERAAITDWLGARASLTQNALQKAEMQTSKASSHDTIITYLADKEKRAYAVRPWPRQKRQVQI
jgi:hypothetical protein